TGDVLLVAGLIVLAEIEAATKSLAVPRTVLVLCSAAAVLPLLARRRVTVVAASYSVGANAERGSIAWVAAVVTVMGVGMAIIQPNDIVFPTLFFGLLPW